MEKGELRHDQHATTLSTDRKVIIPKYRGKILVEKTIALADKGIIRKTCKELKIEIIDMAVNVDHFHLFMEYPLKCGYSDFHMIKGI